MLNPQAVHDVPLDVHAEDVAGVEADLIGVVGQLDAARLSTTTNFDLRLDDHGVASELRRGNRFVHCVSDAAR